MTTVPLLAVSRGLAGGLFGAAYPAALIYLGDTVRADVRQRDVARLMVGVALGTALASIGGVGIVADALSWRVMFVVTGAAAVVLAARLKALPEPARARHGSLLPPVGRVMGSPVTLFVLLCALAEGAILLSTLTLLPPAMEHAGASTTVAGLATGVYGVSVFAFSSLVGRAGQHWHPARLIGLGALAAAAACTLLAFSQAVAVATLAAILLGLAWSSMHSPLQTWATEVLPSARATVVSFFAGSLFVGSSLAAVVGSGFADEGQYAVLFAVSALLAVPLGLSAATVRTGWDRPPTDPAAP